MITDITYLYYNTYILQQIAEMKNCNKCIFFEGRKKQDLYMWVSNVPKGPSAKFYVENGMEIKLPFYMTCI